MNQHDLSGMRTVDQNAWLKELVPGKTFADVGGLWGTKNEKISLAQKANAAECTMIDIAPLGHKLWVDLDVHLAELSVTNYKKAQGDAVSPDFPDTVGMFDVIHCAGILYHLPSPWHLLFNLRRIARESIVLASMTVPGVIENEEGKIVLGGGGALFCPSLNEMQRRVVRRHFDKLGIQTGTITDVPSNGWMIQNRAAYGPWWFLMTQDFICGLAKTLRLDVVDCGEVWQGRASAFLLKVQ